MHKEDLSVLVGTLVKPVQTVIFACDTVGQSIEKLKSNLTDEKIIYFYVVDDNNTLVGVVSTRNLLLCNTDLQVKEIMETPVISLKPSQTLKEALEIFANCTLLALPVIEENGKLLGTIGVQMYMEEKFDIANARHRSDMFQIIGLSWQEDKKGSVFGNYRLRMPWLICNMIGGIFCAMISEYFNVVLAKVVLLAMFIPLVLSLSEGTSVQSMSQMIQYVHRPRKTWKILLEAIWKEFHVVMCVAITCALTVGTISLFWGYGVLPSITIGASIFSCIIITSLFGMIVPILIHKIKLDPKIASGPVVLMAADMITTAFYLTLGTYLIL